MKVFIITEGGKGVGFGHITRCISLYQAFKEKNITPELIVNSDNSVLDLLKGKNYCILNWFREKNKLFRKITNADIIIIDSYSAELSFYKNVSELVKLAVYIDDTKRLDYPRGIVLNGMIYAKNIDYPKKKSIKYILGTKHIPLRKEFWQTSKKIINKNVKSVMVILGGNDGRNMMPKIIKLLNKEYPELIKNVIIGKGFKNTEEIKKLKNKRTILIYNPDAEDMRKLMLKSDIAISAGGQTLYELARIGVPTVGICLAVNQKWNLKGLEKIGFIEYTGWYKDKKFLPRLKKNIDKVISHKERSKRSKIGKRLVDGAGAHKAIDIIINRTVSLETDKYDIEENNIRLRKIKKSDCYDLWLWRNHPNTRKWSFDTKQIECEKHKEWVEEKIRNAMTIIYIAEYRKGKKIGQIRFEMNKGKLAYVSVNLNPIFFGKGIGSKIIKKGTEFFKRDNPNVKEIIAEIINGNIASQKAFQKAGYTFSHSAFKSDKRLTVFKL